MTDSSVTSDWSARDMVGCFGIFLIFWMPPTLLLLGFAGSLRALGEATVEAVMRGDLLMIGYVFLSLGWLLVPLGVAQQMSRRRRSTKGSAIENAQRQADSGTP
jgi:hypothetical protein